MAGFLPRKRPQKRVMPRGQVVQQKPWDFDEHEEFEEVTQYHGPYRGRGQAQNKTVIKGRVKERTTETDNGHQAPQPPISPMVAKTILSIIGILILGTVGFLVINGDIKLPHLGTTPNMPTCQSTHPYYWASDGMCHQEAEQTTPVNDMCSWAMAQVNDCWSVDDSVALHPQVVGFSVPISCGDCPPGSQDIHVDITVDPNGNWLDEPLRQCSCGQ